MIALATTHWLEAVIHAAGLPTMPGFHLDPGLPPADAWAQAARAYGGSQEDLAQRVAAHFHLRVAEVGPVESRVLRLIPEKVALRFGVFPLREDYRDLAVATSVPLDLEAEQMLAFISGRRVTFEVAPPRAIRHAIATYYAADGSMPSLLQGAADEANAVHLMERRSPEQLTTSQVEAAPIVKLTNLLLQQAVGVGASDIHIEPGARGGTVRFRVDGVLRHHMELPPEVFNRVVSRIKVLGKLDIADRVRPQDGSMGALIAGREYDLRISTVPVRASEKAVLRILDPNGAQRLEDIDLPSRELQRLRHLLSHREGIVVVTGPTGSGKTTTLYAAIRELATGKVNITTVEDPIEYKLPQITQIQVDQARGVTFASALRSILRQDPDVIFVGEIRDQETAEMALQASQTGHLVLATLHTNDAVGVIPRLADLGLDPKRIAGSLRGVISQRLVRRICHYCAQPILNGLDAAETELAARYEVDPVARAVGCEHCGQSGYTGRMPVLETLIVDESLRELIARDATAGELQRAAQHSGMRRIHQVARERVAEGETTLQEIHRVLGEVEMKREESLPQVLVVDDDADNRLLARVVLESEGFSVSEAEDGEVALERLHGGERPDLVILDLDMPRIDGRRVLAHLRSSPATASLPVIVLTGSTGRAVEIQVMDEGADDYIRKPLDPPHFAARVKGVLRRVAAR
jgi:type II secretory ATPase GspE/PulE/Tfp pilus assembly ATPase PilB-like protein